MAEIIERYKARPVRMLLFTLGFAAIFSAIGFGLLVAVGA